MPTMPREKKSPQFAICIRSDGYPASLELYKVYRVLPDSEAAGHQLLRVIDESGEDYLYPEDRFVLVDLPPTAARALSGKQRKAVRPSA